MLPQLFTEVVIPPTVFRELQHANTPAAVKDSAQSLPAWVKIQTPTSLDPSLNVDPGELEAICLAREIHAAAVLMDDRIGRNAARRYGLFVTGTIGVLESAAARGLVQFAGAISKLQQTNARLDPELVQAALARDQARLEQERARQTNQPIEPKR